ncbi:MAG: DNA primase [Magnetococcales bacterium]|nr:DNA primase [Magnetococcales bacterium]
MARFTESFLDDVRTRVDLLELVGRSVALKKSGSNWTGLCPFHTEKTPSFSVNPEKGFFKCFGCGAGGDVFAFVMRRQGLAFHEAVSSLAGQAGLEIPRDRDPLAEQRRQVRDRILEVNSRAERYFRDRLAAPEGRAAREYLDQRGLSTETVARFHLGYAPPGWRNLLDHFGGGDAAATLLREAGLVLAKEDSGRHYDRFRDRIIFPIHDRRGLCLGFGGRVMGDEKPKYINSPETPVYRKGEVLFGLDLALESIREEGSVIVVEGYLDLIALASRGVGHVVATLGTALTHRHLAILWQHTPEIRFCFDGDQAGQKAAWRAMELALEHLRSDRRAFFLFLPGSADPDDIVRLEGGDAFRQRVRDAWPLAEFLFRGVTAGITLEGPDGKAAAVSRARPLLQKVGDPLLRELHAEHLAGRLGVTTGHLLVDTTPAPAPSGGEYRAALSRPAAVSRRAVTPVAPQIPLGGAVSGGFDQERHILQMILRHPQLVEQHEEALGRQKIEDPLLAELLTELLVLASTGRVSDTGWPLTDLTLQSQEVARHLCLDEVPEFTDPDQQLSGCLESRQAGSVQGEIDRAITQETEGGQGGAGFWARFTALRREKESSRNARRHHEVAR